MAAVFRANASMEMKTIDVNTPALVEVPKNKNENETQTKTVPEKTTWRIFIFQTFENPDYSPLAYWTNIFVLFVILFSTFTLVISTITWLNETRAQQKTWFALETIVIIIFTVEYFARVITAPNRLRYVLEPLNIIDLVAIIPYYIELIFRATASRNEANLSGLAVLRVLRLVRVLRMFKMGRNSAQLALFVRAMKRSKSGIALLVFLLTLADIFFATCIFYAETFFCQLTEDKVWVYKKWGEGPTPFQSILASMWWALVTMTTVGYGDQSPVTPLGKLIGIATMVIGLLVIAFPVTIIGQNLGDVYSEHKALVSARTSKIRKTKKRKRRRRKKRKK
eukprot:Lithocolla_globosa_v1_NODE_4865_length_1350_cov_4.518919.p1 type:complete len:337 gc:universal NODE_4865_length_1350_cov_4.518919:159-1169(+)